MLVQGGKIVAVAPAANVRNFTSVKCTIRGGREIFTGPGPAHAPKHDAPKQDEEGGPRQAR